MFVENNKIFQQCFKFLLNELGTIVTNEDVGDSEMVEDNLFEKPSDHSGVIGGASKCFHPLGYVIQSYQDIFVPPEGRERVHKIHAPNIEHFKLKNVAKGHFIHP